jgi:3-deoxy-D-manno-octulosonate 8-phosphate phosphatase KdsC-like HAD superfamily phosphatase
LRIHLQGSIRNGGFHLSPSALRNIKAFFTDVDGVLTDGRIILGARNDDEFVAFDVQDGVGRRLLDIPWCG